MLWIWQLKQCQVFSLFFSRQFSWYLNIHVGLTSQPAMGAVVAALQGTNLDTGLKLENLMKLNDYWINVREIYAPFESGQKLAGGFLSLD